MALATPDWRLRRTRIIIEFYGVDDETALITYEKLKETRIRRRLVKNEIEEIEYFLRYIGGVENLKKARKCVEKIQKMDSKSYTPRALPMLFERMEEKQTDYIKYMEEISEMEPSAYYTVDSSFLG